MDISFILPCRLESLDRENNFKKSIDYLCHHAPYHIYILEYDTTAKIPKILNNININGANIYYDFIQNSDVLFHKTKLLNILLKKTTTKVVVNYDIDILLDPRAYEFCYNLIVDDGYDLIYPYGHGEFLLDLTKDRIEKINYDFQNITNDDIKLKICRHGLCQFLSRESYIKYGGMNESFISYGPEDWELGYRFKKLGLKVNWINSYIIHLDHDRGINSGRNHIMAKHNYDFFESIKSMSVEELKILYNIK